jgi:site-specific recombinase XerD
MNQVFTNPSQKYRAVMFRASVKVDIRTWYVKKDGTSEIFLQTTINGEKKMIGLGIYWPLDKFDRNAGICMRLNNKDILFSDYNMIIRDALSRANDIMVYHRMAGRALTVADFEREYLTYFNKADLIEFFSARLEQRLKKGVIGQVTYRNQKYSLNILRKYAVTLPFSELSSGWLQEFDAFMRKKLKLTDANTRFGRHKDLRTYINLAIKENITDKNPYSEFTIPKVKGKWYPLSLQQYQKLHDYYFDADISPFHHRTLRRFLFACHTGLRISDLMSCQFDWLVHDTIVFMPKKTRKQSKDLRLPLTDFALQLFHEEHRASGNNALFRFPTEQKSNETLKSIAKVTGIDCRLHHHMARETFATLYLEFGGQLEVLQEFLGHSDIKTTMRYVHVNQNRKRSEANRLNNLVPTADKAPA